MRRESAVPARLAPGGNDDSIVLPALGNIIEHQVGDLEHGAGQFVLDLSQ